jgi:hypothetical protein
VAPTTAPATSQYCQHRAGAARSGARGCAAAQAAQASCSRLARELCSLSALSLNTTECDSCFYCVGFSCTHPCIRIHSPLNPSINKSGPPSNKPGLPAWYKPPLSSLPPPLRPFTQLSPQPLPAPLPPSAAKVMVSLAGNKQRGDGGGVGMRMAVRQVHSFRTASTQHLRSQLAGPAPRQRLSLSQLQIMHR